MRTAARFTICVAATLKLFAQADSTAAEREYSLLRENEDWSFLSDSSNRDDFWDPNAQVVFYGQTKGAFAGFGLDGATLKRDQTGDEALYGKDITNREIVDSGAVTPAVAQPFIDKLAQTANR